MGIFPHFFSGSPLKIASHVVLPTLPLFTETIKGITPLVSKGIEELHHVGSLSTTPKAAAPQGHPVPSYQPQGYQPPQYITAPGYSPSPFAPSPYSYAPTPDTFSPYGGPSWDYSMTSRAPWSPPSVGYSEAPAPQTSGRIWEDLTQVLPLFL